MGPTSSPLGSDSDVLIVGGGLAGLALAAYLAREGVRATIVERASRWRASGYGIGLWEDGLSVMEDLDRREAVRAEGTDPRGFEVRASGGEVLSRTACPDGRTLLLALHRADLHAALREVVPRSWIRMDTTPERIDERADGVAVTFDDGTTGTYDLVVGADGVHSAVRERCFDDWTLEEADAYVWSLWADQDVDVGRDMVSVWGPGSEGFVVRVGDRVGFNLAARLDSPPDPPGRAALRAQAERIGWRLPALLDGTDDDPYFDRVREVHCESWHTDRVVLLGDAAHAVHPISGMGASLALRDARALAEELTTERPRPLWGALERFERRRRPDAKRVSREARFEAALLFLESKRLRTIRNEAVKRTPIFDWFVRHRAFEW